MFVGRPILAGHWGPTHFVGCGERGPMNLVYLLAGAKRQKIHWAIGNIGNRSSKTSWYFPTWKLQAYIFPFGNYGTSHWYSHQGFSTPTAPQPWDWLWRPVGCSWRRFDPPGRGKEATWNIALCRTLGWRAVLIFIQVVLPVWFFLSLKETSYYIILIIFHYSIYIFFHTYLVHLLGVMTLLPLLHWLFLLLLSLIPIQNSHNS